MKKATNKKLSLEKLNIAKLDAQHTIVGGREPGVDLTIRPRITNTTTEGPTQQEQ